MQIKTYGLKNKVVNHPMAKRKKQNLEDLALEGGRTTPWPPQTGQGGGSATPFFFF
jgi:hypothetical protein